MKTPARKGGPAIACAAALALGLAACGEQPQVVVYEQGRYQGKVDAAPWDGPPFNGERSAWEAALKNRARGQNEYTRSE
jgi:hypothetical protein